MSKRSLPPIIRDFIGPCRKPETVAEEVAEQCGLGKMMGDVGLTDYDPFIVVMRLVALKMGHLGHPVSQTSGQNIWCDTMRVLQQMDYLEHNHFIPCRTCNIAFEPEVDVMLFALFLAWYESRRISDLLAIHRCPACGGRLAAKRTRPYAADMHTPEPGSIKDDDDWVEILLQFHG